MTLVLVAIVDCLYDPSKNSSPKQECVALSKKHGVFDNYIFFQKKTILTLLFFLQAICWCFVTSLAYRGISCHWWVRTTWPRLFFRNEETQKNCKMKKNCDRSLYLNLNCNCFQRRCILSKALSSLWRSFFLFCAVTWKLEKSSFAASCQEWSRFNETSIWAMKLSKTGNMDIKSCLYIVYAGSTSYAIKSFELPINTNDKRPYFNDVTI